MLHAALRRLIVSDIIVCFKRSKVKTAVWISSHVTPLKWFLNLLPFLYPAIVDTVLSLRVDFNGGIKRLISIIKLAGWGPRREDDHRELTSEISHQWSHPSIFYCFIFLCIIFTALRFEGLLEQIPAVLEEGGLNIDASPVGETDLQTWNIWVGRKPEYLKKSPFQNKINFINTRFIHLTVRWWQITLSQVYEVGIICIKTI